MQHYWGAEAIVERLGYSRKYCTHLRDLIATEHLPVFLRKHGKHLHKIYYASEQGILIWELTKAKLYREQMLAKQEAKQLAKGKPPLIRKGHVSACDPLAYVTGKLRYSA